MKKRLQPEITELPGRAVALVYAIRLPTPIKWPGAQDFQVGASVLYAE